MADTMFRHERYIEAARVGEIGRVASAPNGDRNNALFRGAAALGSLNHLGLDAMTIENDLIRACQENGLLKEGGIDAARKTIVSGMSAGMRNPRQISANDNQPTINIVHQNAGPGAAPPQQLHIPAIYPAWTPEDGGDEPGYVSGDAEPPALFNEVARYLYRRAGEPLRVKIKSKKQGTNKKQFTNWYKVTSADGSVGWQSKKPAGFEAVPYTGFMDALDPELAGDQLWLPEGEKDVDSLTGIGIPAMTFGSSSDLPHGWEQYVAGREVIICADNDEAGRNHGEKKAAQCAPVAKSVKVFHFTDMGPGADVSDWLASGHTDQELFAMAEAAPLWRPPIVSAVSAIPASPSGAWDEPDWSILDDQRGDLPKFPVHALPCEWRDWLCRAAHGAGAMPDHVAVPLIAIASGLIGTARRVQASRSWSQPCTLWTAVVGYSGSGKTPGLEAVTRALGFIERNRKDHVAELRRAYDTKLERAKAAESVWKEEVKGAVQQGSDPPLKPAEAVHPGEFVTPRISVSDITIERIAVLLQGRPSGIVVIRDELAGLFANMSRYSNGQDNEFWLQCWNGGQYVVERQNRPPVTISHLLVGLTGGFQPDKISRSFDGDHNGMYARFCFGWPTEPGYRPLSNDVDEIEPEVVNALARLVDLAAADADEFLPGIIPLSPEALLLFEQLRKDVDTQRKCLDGRESEWVAKGPAHVLRLAGTLAYMAWSMRGGPEPTNVDASHMDSAILIWNEYFKPHSLAAIRRIGVSDLRVNERRALQWIIAKRLREVSVQDIRRDALSQKLTAEQTQKLLTRLVEANCLRDPGLPTSPAGRPKLRWPVNPRLFDRRPAEIAEIAKKDELRHAA